MKNYILTAVGIAGILIANSPNVTHAAGNEPLLALGSRPSIYIDAPPTFIYVPELGYSVAVESPYDFMYYDNYYYLYDNGSWYSSSFYDGPWLVMMEDRLPPSLRGHRIPDIRRFRDIEYRKHDRQYWQDRDQHDRRSQGDAYINNNNGLFDARRTRSSQGRYDEDGRNRGESGSDGDNRAPVNMRGGGDHPSGDWRGGGRGR